jgi:type III secretory pathway component EscS
VIEALARLLHGGFGLLLASLLPLFAIAAVAVIVVGLLGGALGIRDGALGHIVRTLAIVLALGLVAERTATAIVAFTVQSWAGLDGSERAGDPFEPAGDQQ